MVPHTRRRLLQVATAAAGALAGCGGLIGDQTRMSHSSSASDEPTDPDGAAETDPPTVLLRSDSERPLVRLADADEADVEPPRWDRPSPRHSRAIIDSESKSQRITVVDGGDDERVSSFVSETDFDGETLYLENRWVRECFRLQLCSISWEPDRVRTHYVRTLRSWDEPCVVDARVAESRLVRIPDALEESSVSGYGSSTSGSGRCGGPRARTQESIAAGSSTGTDNGSDGGER